MRPRNPIHPGKILLEEFLVPKGISQRAFAEELNWTPARLNELIKGKRGITADAALNLAEALGTSAEVWMNLQAMFDLHVAELKRKKASQTYSRIRAGKSFMNIEQLNVEIRAALNEFLNKDSHLLDVNSSERSITHSIAVCIANRTALSAWDVDCEYSRDGDEVKTICVPQLKGIEAGDLEAKTVYPDIIIHMRGDSGSNLLAIEVKKHGRSNYYDETKVTAYIKQLEYQFGLLLTLPKLPSSPLDFDWRWRNAMGNCLKWP
jgi:antitoxin HigA-1